MCSQKKKSGSTFHKKKSWKQENHSHLGVSFVFASQDFLVFCGGHRLPIRPSGFAASSLGSAAGSTGSSGLNHHSLKPIELTNKNTSNLQFQESKIAKKKKNIPKTPEKCRNYAENHVCLTF